MNPNDAAAYNMRAGCYNRKGRFDKALPDFEKALKLAPAAVLTNNDLAWFLATCPDAGYRNGARALELSQNAFKAARKGKDQVVLCATLDTMGAAYAEAGKFDRAIATQKKVIALLKKLDAPEMLVECRERLDAYKAHRAWREK